MLLTVMFVFKGRCLMTKRRVCIVRQQEILAFVHSDLAGPIQPTGKDGYKYM